MSKYLIPVPEGQILVCAACGKTSKTLEPGSSPGWDESCMLWAIRCYDRASHTDARNWQAVTGNKALREVSAKGWP